MATHAQTETESRRSFGGAQEGAGRKPKPGNRTNFKLSPRGREILELAKTREKQKQLAPALEKVLEDYAQRYELPVTTPKAGEDREDKE